MKNQAFHIFFPEEYKSRLKTATNGTARTGEAQPISIENLFPERFCGL
jgi:hypothetical protein